MRKKRCYHGSWSLEEESLVCKGCGKVVKGDKKGDNYLYENRHSLPLEEMTKLFKGDFTSFVAGSLISALDCKSEDESEHQSDRLCENPLDDWHEEMRPKSKILVTNDDGEPIGYDRV